MAQTLSSAKTGWHYRVRVVLFLLGLAAVALVVFGSGSSLDRPSHVGRSTSHWIELSVLLVVGGVCLVLAVRTKAMADRMDAWVNGKTWLLWILLGVLLYPTSVFGQWARLSVGNIVRLELAGSQRVAVALHYPAGSVNDALRADIGFIVGYVLVLVFLVQWSGRYYRLEPVRRARTPLCWAVVSAGAFDVLEDLFIWWGQQNQAGTGTNVRWELAATCAWAKFAILLAVIGFVLGGAWTWLLTPRWVREASWALVKPASSQDDRADRPDQRPTKAPYGIALSGGGIRAASISLGALQVLENSDDDQPPLGWDQASVVTAVSGGSNMAAGWSLARSSYDTNVYGCANRIPPADLDPKPWELDPDMTLEEQHLFANLGYLLAATPRATANSPEAPLTSAEKTANSSPAAKAQRYRPTALATAFGGFVVNVGVFVIALWVIVTPFGWMLAQLGQHQLQGGEIRDLVTTHNLGFPGVVLAGAGLLLILTWVLLGQLPVLSVDLDSSRTKQVVFNACKFGGYGLLGLGTILLILLAGLPLLASWLETGGLRALVGSAAGAAGVLGSVARILRKPGAKFAPYLGGIAFAIFVVLVAGVWITAAARLKPAWLPGPGHESVLLWLIGLAVLVILPLWVSPEWWSLAGFYRGKLRIAYGTYRDGDGLEVYLNDVNTADKHAREPWLHSFRTTAGEHTLKSTPLTICGTVTVSSKSVKTHYDIPALSVTFDPSFVSVHVPESNLGDWAAYEASSEVINAMGFDGRKRLTTMMAAAIASAAVSPAMGRIRIGPTSMLLAFANVRLGVWMPNPRYANAHQQLPSGEGQIGYPHTGLGYLFKEFLGIHDLSDPYLYMTDGGHWENTGLVEMLRRKDIHEVVCIDADCGSLTATESLGKALDLAPLECGVRIQINLDPLRARVTEVGPGYAERTVAVGFFRQGPDWTQNVGVLWYAKPGLTADMSTALLGFRESHADFPVTSTSDQFFDSATYIAYRELGRFNGRRIRKARNQLVQFLASLDLPHESALAGLPAETNDRVLGMLEAIGGWPWVVEELVRSTQLMPRTDRVAFLVAVSKALDRTAAAISAVDPS